MTSPQTPFERELFNLLTKYNIYNLLFSERLRAMHSMLETLDSTAAVCKKQFVVLPDAELTGDCPF